MTMLLNCISEEPAAYSNEPSGRKGKPPLPESVLARLWQRRAARQEWFRTSQGRRVRVLYPGRPGTSAGPDFRNALLHFEGEGLVQGDVEIHRRQQDWYSHGHRDDPNYNGVVLHAALYLSPAPTHRHSGGEVPVVSLSPLLPVEGDAAEADPPVNPQPDRESRPGLDAKDSEASAPAGSVWPILARLGYPPPGSPAALERLLDRAGDARFAAKSARFRKYQAEQPAEQALYEGLMESLGYRQNQQPFVRLAGCARYAVLEMVSAELPPDTLPATLESWLTQLSGLPLDRATNIIPLPSHGFANHMNGREWHCFRVRPVNHPRRRIGGAARLLARCFDGTMPGGLVEGLSLAVRSGKARELTAALTVAAGGVTYVGTARAKEMAVNVALPFLHGLAELRGDTATVSACLDVYHRYGKLADNEVQREMNAQLSQPGWDRLAVNARRQQGLIHLQRLLNGAVS